MAKCYHPRYLGNAWINLIKKPSRVGYGFEYKTLEQIQTELNEFHAIINELHVIEFESDHYYTMFILKYG